MKKIDLELSQAEKEVLEKLKKLDPAKVDFSEDLFADMHDVIMASVQKTEIKSPSSAAALDLADKWRRKGSELAKKAKTPILFAGLAASIIAAALSVEKQTIIQTADKASDSFIEEAARTPQAFETLVAQGLGREDFLVDLGDRKIDDLKENEVYRLLSSHRHN